MQYSQVHFEYHLVFIRNVIDMSVDFEALVKNDPKIFFGDHDPLFSRRVRRVELSRVGAQV